MTHRVYPFVEMNNGKVFYLIGASKRQKSSFYTFYKGVDPMGQAWVIYRKIE
jgi:hypothetical protein